MNTTRLKALVARLSQSDRKIRKRYINLTKRYTAKIPVSVKWFTENFYLIDAQLKQLKKELTPQLFETLPTLKEGRFKGYPRIYKAAQDYVSQNDWNFTDSSLIEFFQNYQDIRVLKSAEIWSLPVLLRFILLENLSVAHDTEGVKNSVTSLRKLSFTDWKAFFEAVSPVEKILKKDPSNIYGKLTPESKDRYRHTIEEIARFSENSEIQISDYVLTQAQEHYNKDLAQAHVGYYLSGPRLHALKRKFVYNPSLLNWCIDVVHRFPLAIYFLSIGSIAIAILFSIAPTAILVLPFFILASEIAVRLVNIVLSSFLPPTPPFQLDFSEGIPLEHETVIAVPCLITDIPTIDNLLFQMERRYLGNAQKGITFAFLTDFADAKEEHAPHDRELLKAMREGVINLNKKYSDKNDLFYLFHRKRQFNKQEGVWMGWERKRGKLIDFVRYLKTSANPFSCIEGDTNAFSPKYVITLDADTKLPLDCAIRLIGALAHPLNRPIIDDSTHMVTEGYGIIQPRVDIAAEDGHKSYFTKIFSANGGLDPYSSAVSNTYQDTFGQATYSGKAIFDVNAYFQVLTNRFPENALLSHDILEGGYLRVGYASDIQLLEDFPSGYDSFLTREHRWVRGDWQFIPWIKNKDLSFLSRWQLIDNLRKSLLAPSVLMLLIAFWMGSFKTPLSGTVIVLMLYLLPHTVDFLLTLSPQYMRESKDAFWFAARSEARTILARGFLMVSFLLADSINLLNAIVITISRLTISRKHLLEWVTAAEQEKRKYTSIARYLLLFRASILTAAIIAISIALINPAALLVVSPFVLLWLIAPVTGYLISRPITEKRAELSSSDTEMLRGVAQKIWTYFDELSTEEYHHLPPDIYQVSPHPRAVYKTSPTNVGLYLLSLLSAQELNLITEEEMVKKLTLVLATIAKMPKYKGHLYNWYDGKTLKPLSPAYISTVDSGNFVACLITLKAARPVFAKKIDALINKHDFSFLYNQHQELFSIGFNTENEMLDDSFFDILDSESRLTSLIAIGMKQVPTKHWFHLSRPLALFKGGLTVKSWGGSIFEHFFANLFLGEHKHTLLGVSSDTMIKKHMDFGRKNNAPWGISEASYFELGMDKTYQYRIFGDPDLGIKPDLHLFHVVSSYSTFLTLPFYPEEAVKNLRMFESMEMLSTYGFFESVDFTSTNLSEEKEYAVVQTYLSHHQAMSLISINNYLHTNSIAKKFLSDPRIIAVETLLEEQIPKRPTLAS